MKGIAYVNNKPVMEAEMMAQIVKVKNNEPIELLIQGDVEVIKQLVLSADGQFQYSAGDIAKVTLPIQNIDKVVSNPAIQRIETMAHTARPLNDTMLKNSKVLRRFGLPVLRFIIKET